MIVKRGSLVWYLTYMGDQGEPDVLKLTVLLFFMKIKYSTHKQFITCYLKVFITFVNDYVG